MTELQFADVLIIFGFFIQLFNVIRCAYFAFMRKDVIMNSRIVDRVMTVVVFALIILFTVSYYMVFQLRLGSLLVGILLFFGAVFVAIMLHWIIGITYSVKGRALQISGSLIGIMESRDVKLDGHSVHIARLVSVFYEYLPVRYKRAINPENLKYAALFHDIGKLGVPEEILHKAGKLTPEEWALMKRHPQISTEILKPLKAFEPILDWILYHHERMDGQGYYGLKGDEIPVASRMLAIADTFSAVTVNKSYKPARTYEDGIMTVKMASGTQLDPELVEVFCNIPKHKIENCAAEVGREMDSITESI